MNILIFILATLGAVFLIGLAFIVYVIVMTPRIRALDPDDDRYYEDWYDDL